MRNLHVAADVVERAASRRAQEIDQRLLLAKQAVLAAVLPKTGEPRVRLQANQQIVRNGRNRIVTAKALVKRIGHFPFHGSVENFDGILGPDRPLRQHRAINTRGTVMTARHPAQHLRVYRRSIRVERDHLAARVAVEDGDYDLRSDPQLTTDEFVLRKPASSS